MAITVTCECGKQFQTGDEYAGRRARCPDCGRELVIPKSNPYGAPLAEPSDLQFSEPTTSGKAIASLILGLTSIFCLLNIMTGIPAIILGALGLGEINRGQGRLKGKGMATTGIVTGAFACTLMPFAIIVALLLPAVQAAREAARRAQCVNNLKQIGLAMHNMNDANGTFPAAAISDRDGKPLLSWRVAILPYLEQQSLYNQFKLDEPWDSPTNKPLIAQMPAVYRCPSDPETGDRTTTRYQVITGPGTLFEGEKGTPIQNITDGTSNTLMVVEADNAVPWTKPEDLSYMPNLPPPTFGSRHSGGVNALFADGSVRFLKKTINPEVMRSLITRNGGEVISADSY